LPVFEATILCTVLSLITAPGKVDAPTAIPKTGKEKVVPLDEDFFDRMKDLTDGIVVDLDDELGGD
jgi:hypothetical protein